MKVVYDISTLGWGHKNNYARTGIYRSVENVARGLRDSNKCELKFSAIGSFRILAQCLDYLESQPDLKAVGIEYEGLDRNAAIYLDQLAHRLNGSKRSVATRGLRKLSNAGIDLIDLGRKPLKSKTIESANIFHSSQFPLPAIGKNGFKAKRFLTVYDLIPLIYPQYAGAGFSTLFQKIIGSITPHDWLISISNSVKNDVCNHLGFDPARVFVAPLAAERNLFYPCRDSAKQARVRKKYSLPETPYVLTLGSLEPRKNLRQSVESFHQLVAQEAINDLALVVVGEKTWGYEDTLERANKLASIKNRTVFTGYVDDDDLAPLYSGALAFMYPSLCEGFGLPPLEAMQCGVPVICSNATSLPEVVGDAAIQIDPSDTDAWCQSLLEVYSKASLRETLAKKSIERAEKFSWQRCTDAVLEAYRTALNN